MIVYGPPAAGSRTLARQLATKLNAVLVDVDSVLQAERQAGSKLGTKIKIAMESNQPVASSIITTCTANRLAQEDCKARVRVVAIPRFIEA